LLLSLPSRRKPLIFPTFCSHRALIQSPFRMRGFVSRPVFRGPCGCQLSLWWLALPAALAWIGSSVSSSFFVEPWRSSGVAHPRKAVWVVHRFTDWINASMESVPVFAVWLTLLLTAHPGFPHTCILGGKDRERDE